MVWISFCYPLMKESLGTGMIHLKPSKGMRFRFKRYFVMCCFRSGYLLYSYYLLLIFFLFLPHNLSLLVGRSVLVPKFYLYLYLMLFFVLVSNFKLIFLYFPDCIFRIRNLLGQGCHKRAQAHPTCCLVDITVCSDKKQNYQSISS